MEPVHNPMVSIVIPVHNAAPYLAKCLDGVLAQTYRDFEVLCVNDASVDESLDILYTYATTDDRFRIASGVYGGPSATRNVALEHARGTYVAFLDSDDYWEPDMLERTVACAEQTQADMVIFDYWLLYHETSELDTYRDQEFFARMDGTVCNLDTCPDLAGFVGIWDRLFRRSFIEDNGLRFVEGHLYEDAMFCARALISAQRIAMLADHLYYYRRNVIGSITYGEDSSFIHEQDFLFAQSFIQTCYRYGNISREAWKAYAGYFAEYAYMHQREIHDYDRFKAFFDVIRDMACSEDAEGEELFDLLEGDSNPARALYAGLVRANKPMLAFAESEGIRALRPAR